MKTKYKALLTAIIIISSSILSGCWNYREVDQLAIVAGIAVDKGVNEKFSITVEIVEVGFGKEAEPKPRTLTMEGETIFDAVRHIITLIGKRLYWSHSKLVIISQEMAEDGVLQILDWFNRDGETRSDIHIIVSKERTAKEILTSQPITETVVSYEIDKAINNQRSLHHAADIEIWRFSSNLQSRGITAIATAINLDKIDGRKGPNVDGTAIFKGDRLVGFINGNETMSLLFVQNEIKGGLLVVKKKNGGQDTEVSLEIFKNETKLKPVIRNGSIEIDISIETVTAIDEIETSEDLIAEDGRKELETLAEKLLKTRIEGIIKKAQAEYGADIFGFGDLLRSENPSVWNTVENDWSNIFKDIKVNVETKVQIRNSAMLSKPLEVGY